MKTEHFMVSTLDFFSVAKLGVRLICESLRNVSQRMHQLARLLTILCARSQEKEAGLETFIDTLKFDDLVAAVKELCRFNEESRLDIGIQSLALKLGHSIEACAQVVKCSALRRKDENVIKKAKRFIDLFESEWTSKIC